MGNVVFDAESHGRLSSFGTSSVTISHTIGAGANRILLVAVGARADQSTSPFTSLKYNGVDMIPGRSDNQGAVAAGTRFYYMLNPPSGTHDLVGTVGSPFTDLNLHLSSWSAVNQGTPFSGSGNGSGNSNAASPVSNTITVPAGGYAVDCFYANDPLNIPVAGGGQTSLSVIAGSGQSGSSYRLNATTMSWSFSGGTSSEQIAHTIVALNPAPDPAAGTITITTDAAVFAGTANQGASTSAVVNITTDADVFSGTAGTVPGTIVTGAFKNNTGTVLANLTGLSVTALRLSDLLQTGTLTGQTTNGSGVMTISSQIITPGLDYLIVTKNAAGTVFGCEKYTAA